MKLNTYSLTYILFTIIYWTAHVDDALRRFEPNTPHTTAYKTTKFILTWISRSIKQDCHRRREQEAYSSATSLQAHIPPEFLSTFFPPWSEYNIRTEHRHTGQRTAPKINETFTRNSTPTSDKRATYWQFVELRYLVLFWASVHCELTRW